MRKMFMKVWSRTIMPYMTIVMFCSLAISVSSCDDENGEDVDVDAGPTVLSFSPASAKVGEAVTITGFRLKDATDVKFNSTSGEITNSTSTTVTVTVPDGATRGRITVITPGGQHMSTDTFTILFPPTITSISPTEAEIGEVVTITGTQLSTATSVKFGNASAIINQQSSTTIITAVPVGATTGKVTISGPGGEAVSATDFTVIIPEPPAPIVEISDFEEDTADEMWQIAMDVATEQEINAIETEGDNSYFRLKATDNNVNHWVGGRYHEIALTEPLGVTETDMTKVWMTVDVKANAPGVHVGKLVYAVAEDGGPDGRRNFERDFDVDWQEWTTISIRVDNFGFWNGSSMTSASTHLPNIASIWSVALYVKGGSSNTYDLSFDNLRFNQGEPEGEEVDGHF